MNATAQAVRAASEWFSWAGTEYMIQVTSEESGGAVGMFEGIVPAGDGPPIHVHHNEDEVIHVLEGAYRFWLDGAVTTRGPGTSIFLPRGVPHSFQVIGPERGRNLAVVTPGGFEGFFIDVSTGPLAIPADMPEIVEIGARYGLEFVGPPLAAL